MFPRLCFRSSSAQTANCPPVTAPPSSGSSSGWGLRPSSGSSSGWGLRLSSGSSSGVGPLLGALGLLLQGWQGLRQRLMPPVRAPPALLRGCGCPGCGGLPFGSAGCPAAQLQATPRVTAGAPPWCASAWGWPLQGSACSAPLSLPWGGFIAPSMCSPAYRSTHVVRTHVASTEAESSVFIWR